MITDIILCFAFEVRPGIVKMLSIRNSGQGQDENNIQNSCCNHCYRHTCFGLCHFSIGRIRSFWNIPLSIWSMTPAAVSLLVCCQVLCTAVEALNKNPESGEMATEQSCKGLKKIPVNLLIWENNNKSCLELATWMKTNEGENEKNKTIWKPIS